MSRWNIPLFAGAALLAAAPFATRYSSAPTTPSLSTSETPAAIQAQPARAPDKRSTINRIPTSANPTEASIAAQSQAELQKNICGFLKEYAGDSVPTTTAPNTHASKTHASKTHASKTKAEPFCTSNPDASARNIPASHTKVVLTILPDPVHTHLALRFDRAIDSIQGALQRLGYTFDHSWLPWDNRGHNVPERFNDRLTDESLRRARDTTPGVLLFRRSDPTDLGPPLVLLLVGDTPTSGVNNQQFRNAIAIWKQFALHNIPADPRAIRGIDNPPPNIYPYCGAEAHLAILGPTFSGSGQSLKHLIDQELTPLAKNLEVRVSVSSGTISADDQLNGLETAYDKCGIGLHVEPKSFNIDLLYSRFQLLDYLVSRKTPGKIMQLVEAESTFGSIEDKSPREVAESHVDDDRKQLTRYLCPDKSSDQACVPFLAGVARRSHPAKKRKASPKSDVNPTDTAWRDIEQSRTQLINRNCPPKGADETCIQLLDDIARWKNLIIRLKDADADDRVGVLHYPREISRLRRAYEQGGIVNFTSANSGPRTELSFNFGSDNRDDDTVPLFSGSQGDVAMETQMSQIASLLQADHVSTVILSATDVLDEIFVARYLAQHTPDLTVIIQDSDQLFLRQGSDAVMNEIYVATPWPLIGKNQRWSSPKDQEQLISIAHPSLSDQGIYNATEYLLCDPDFTDRSQIEHASLPCRPDKLKHRDDTLHNPANGITLDEYQPPIGLGIASSLDLKEEPPLWLSVIERGQFTPVALIDIDNEKHGLPESSLFNLPRIFESPSKDGKEVNDRPTHPRGLIEETALTAKLAATAILLLLLLHGSACLLCKLHRPFAWSYALADKEQHWTRVLLQAALPLIAIPALSLLLIPPGLGLTVQHRAFEVYLSAIQFLAIAVACIGPLVFVVNSGDPAEWLNLLSGDPAEWLSLFPWFAPTDSTPPEHSTSRLLRLSTCVVTAAAGLLLVYLCHRHLWNWLAPSAENPAERIFFFYRGAYLFCGSSPALTLLLLLAALAFWTQRMFARLVFFGHRIPKVPNGHTDLRCPSETMLRPLTSLLSEWTSPLRYVLFAASAFAVFLVMLHTEPGVVHSDVPQTLGTWLTEPRGPRSLAHSSFDSWVAWLSAIVATLIIHDLLTAAAVWTRLSELCLIPLKQSPLRWGFTWIKGFSWRRILTSTQNLSPEQTFDYLMRLIEANERPGGNPAVKTTFSNLRLRYYQSPRNLHWVNDVSEALGSVQTAISYAGSIHLEALAKAWHSDIGPVTGSGTEKGLDGERGIHMNRSLADAKDPKERRPILKRMASEEFVALIYLSYVRMVLVQIRNRILTAACLYVLLLWSLTSYPWMNRHAILLALSILLGLMSLVAFLIYSQMHRDHILSRTTETEPGKLDGGFIERLLPVIGIPLLTLIASQFPEVSNFVFSWLEPSLSKMH